MAGRGRQEPAGHSGALKLGDDADRLCRPQHCGVSPVRETAARRFQVAERNLLGANCPMGRREPALFVRGPAGYPQLKRLFTFRQSRFSFTESMLSR